jgi:hypothetical protein
MWPCTVKQCLARARSKNGDVPKSPLRRIGSADAIGRHDFNLMKAAMQKGGVIGTPSIRFAA